MERERESDREKGTSSEKRRERRERESKPFWYYPFYDFNRHLIGKMQYKVFFSTFMEGISRDTGS